MCDVEFEIGDFNLDDQLYGIARLADSIAHGLYDHINSYWLKSGVSKCMGGLQVKFSDDTRVNMSSQVREGREVITISRGVLDLYSYVEKQMRHSIFHEVAGMDSRDYPNDTSFEMMISADDGRFLLDSKSIVAVAVKNIVGFMIQHILLHEMGHFFNGHHAYLNRIENRNPGDSVVFNHTQDGEAIYKDRELGLVFEYDADAFADCQIVHLSMNRYPNFGYNEPTGILRQDNLFFFLGAAIYGVLMRGREINHRADTYQDGSKYLPPMMRFIRFFDRLEVLLLGSYSLSEEQAERILERVYGGARWAYENSIDLGFSGFWDHSQEYYDIHRDVIKQISRKYDDIRPVLDRYARCNLDPGSGAVG